jgi:glutamyl-tRNA synthetase
MKFTKGDTVVSLEKLWFLQKRHAARYASFQPPKPSNPSHDLEELAVKPLLNALSHQALQDPERFSFYRTIPEGDARFEFVRSIVWADAQNYTSPEDFISREAYFFASLTPSILASNRYRLVLHHLPLEINRTVPESTFLPLVQTIYDISEQKWSKTELKARITSIVEKGSAGTLDEMRKESALLDEMELEFTVKKSWVKLVHGYIRWAMVARMPGPDGAETMRILGRSESLRRLDAAREVLQMSNEMDERDEVSSKKMED